MPKVKINADGVGYSLPNPAKDQPPILAAAYRGEVVEMSADEVARLRKVRVRVFYTDPVSGVANGAYREEPSVVDANEAETVDADAMEAARKKVTDLEDALAQARADLPLAAGGPVMVVPLLSQGAVRELPPLDVPLLATDDEADAKTAKAKAAAAKKAAAAAAAARPAPPAPPAE